MDEKLEKLLQMIAAENPRSAWRRGVKEYALELAAGLAENINSGWVTPEVLTDRKAARAAMLNGARDWSQYSWGGCSLVYDTDIAARLCTPSEYRKCKGGAYRPNRREQWLDTQGRALYQACCMVLRALEKINQGG